MNLPWYEGNVRGHAIIWDADHKEVKIQEYSALIVAAVNRTESKWNRFRRWLAQEPVS